MVVSDVFNIEVIHVIFFLIMILNKLTKPLCVWVSLPTEEKNEKLINSWKFSGFRFKW